MASGRLIAAIANVNRTHRPEHDRVLRIRILVTVCISVVSVILSGAAPLAESLAILLLLPVGFLWSYHHRTSSNYAAKAIISVLALGALWRFFSDILNVGSIDDARLPLTLMFLEIQVLHAFDLPQRRDLVFTLSSSLALIGLAVSTGPGPWLLPVVVAYLIAAGASLQRYQTSVDREWLEGASRTGTTTTDAAVARNGDRWRTTRYALTVMAVAGLVFASVPIKADASLGGLPFSFGDGGGRNAQGSGRVGGDLPFGESDGDGSRDADPLEYFGFAERVDPRSVGELSDIPVMRVRTNRPRPYRGVVFDLYVDGVWGRSESEPDPVQGLPVVLESGFGSASRTTRVTQTFELLRATPNLMFGAASPTEVWTAARSVTPWTDGTMTTGIEMTAGTVYSVISEVDVTPPEILLRAPFDYSGLDEVSLARWTDLPDSVPQRVHDLATDLALAAPTQTPYAIAEQMQAWIGDHVEYSLEAEPTPADVDPADHILFDNRLGWCEPIATSMVVMLRSVGIPARFVTGFQPGVRNILSGQYTIRASDAHAWVEVLVPDHGWVTFDPTGATAQALDPDGPGPQVLLLILGRWLAQQLSRDPVVWLTIVVGLSAVASAAVVLRRSLHARRLRAAGPWAGLMHRLATEGLRPPLSETPQEVIRRAQRALPHLDPQALQFLGQWEEDRRYAGHPDAGHPDAGHPDAGHPDDPAPATEALARL